MCMVSCLSRAELKIENKIKLTADKNMGAADISAAPMVYGERDSYFRLFS